MLRVYILIGNDGLGREEWMVLNEQDGTMGKETSDTVFFLHICICLPIKEPRRPVRRSSMRRDARSNRPLGAESVRWQSEEMCVFCVCQRARTQTRTHKLMSFPTYTVSYFSSVFSCFLPAVFYISHSFRAIANNECSLDLVG